MWALRSMAAADTTVWFIAQVQCNVVTCAAMPQRALCNFYLTGYDVPFRAVRQLRAGLPTLNQVRRHVAQ
jgi:hypothetical protein